MEASGKKLPEQPALPAPATQSEEPGGWDPYEVWRTRVLQPRLQTERSSSTLQIVEIAPLPLENIRSSG